MKPGSARLDGEPDRGRGRGPLGLGLLTPLPAAGVVGVMLVAWITNHLRQRLFHLPPRRGWEYVMTLTMMGVVIGTLGPGRWSHRRRPAGLLGIDGWSGL